MALTGSARKLSLTLHVTSSVGWLGAVAAFLALAITGVVSEDAETVRGAYLVMELTGWFILVPLSVASLLTGLASSLGTTWGLFRHYWVVVKLLINLFATLVLLMYMQTLEHYAGVAKSPSALAGDLSELRSASPILHASAALALLVVATVLGIYKPRGVTRYGQRKQRERRALAPSRG